MRVLGVDLGARRTGLSVSDPTGMTCRPLEVVRGKDRDGLADRVAEVAEREGAEKIVLGLPRPLGGGRNEQMEDAETFAGRLRVKSPLPVVTWDERFTTALAARSVREGSRTAVDSLAACHLLQSYLDAVAREGAGGGPDEG